MRAGLLDRLRIGGRPQDRNRLVIDFALKGRVENVVWNFEQNRAAFAAAHRVKGAAQEVGKLLHRMRHGRPFGDRPIDFGGAERRADKLSISRKPGRDDEQRHVLGIGLRDAGKGILDARSLLSGEYAVLPAAANAAEAVGHADADALLPAEDRTDIDLGAGSIKGLRG